MELERRNKKEINFRLCSECGLPQEQNQLNTHWRRKHGEVLYQQYRVKQKLNLEEATLPRHPHNEWIDRLVRRLDNYPRKSVKSNPYWEFLYQYAKKQFSQRFWHCRDVWRLTLPDPSIRK